MSFVFSSLIYTLLVHLLEYHNIHLHVAALHTCHPMCIVYKKVKSTVVPSVMSDANSLKAIDQNGWMNFQVINYFT